MHSSKTSTEKDHRVLVLNGDGIGPEVMTETLRALDVLKRRHALRLEWETAFPTTVFLSQIKHLRLMTPL